MSIPQPTKESSGSGCWKFGLIGCGVIAAIVVLGMVGMVYYVSKNTAVKQMVLCSKNMQEIHAALVRYEIRNKTYPSDLRELVPDFLPNKSVLHCPADSSTIEVSYTYMKPAPGAPDTTIVLSCDRHKFKDIVVPLRMQKDGRMAPQEHPPGSPKPVGTGL